MHAFFVFLLAFILGCTDKPSSAYNTSVPFDPQKATLEGEKYIDTLYGSKDPNGPICLGSKVSGDYTECSFTYTDTDGSLKAGTILCSSTGCMKGSAETAITAANMPMSQLGEPGITDEWLFWYLLFSNGGTSHTYHHWHNNTPSYGRTAYYSSTYIPSAQSRNYYNVTYSKPVTNTTSTKYATKTSYNKPVSTSPTKTTTSSPKSTTTTNSNKSSGWGTSSRSSGYSSSPSRSSGSSSGRR